MRKKKLFVKFVRSATSEKYSDQIRISDFISQSAPTAARASVARVPSCKEVQKLDQTTKQRTHQTSRRSHSPLPLCLCPCSPRRVQPTPSSSERHATEQLRQELAELGRERERIAARRTCVSGSRSERADWGDWPLSAVSRRKRRESTELVERAAGSSAAFVDAVVRQTPVGCPPRRTAT